MNKEPIIKFTDEKELKEYLEWWQERLYLSDWIIRGKFIISNMEDSAAGYCIPNFVNKTAEILLVKKVEGEKDFRGDYDKWDNENDKIETSTLEKLPEEQILIHELLHCKFVTFLKNGFVEEFISFFNHQLLNDMSKSLLMTKYNLDPSWFKNF